MEKPVEFLMEFPYNGGAWPRAGRANTSPTCQGFCGGSRNNKNLRLRQLLCPGGGNLENHVNQETKIPLLCDTALKKINRTKLPTRSSWDAVAAATPVLDQP